MNDLKIFNSNQFGEVRTVVVNNEPMFCLADVCRVLEIKNARDCKNRLNQDGVGTTDIIDSMGRTQEATFINESNLYKVIFQSRKKEAEQFADWVTSEVLPSIRKHGVYAIEEVLNNPDMLIKSLEALKAERAKNAELTAENEKMKPKALFADAVSASKNSILIRDLAKLIRQNGIKIGEKRLYQWLREHNYICKSDTSPTQTAMEMGLFEVMIRTIENGTDKPIETRTTRVTGKGQVYFVNKFLSIFQ